MTKNEKMALKNMLWHVERAKTEMEEQRFTGRIQQSEMTCELESTMDNVIEYINEKLGRGKKSHEELVEKLMNELGDEVSANDLVNLATSELEDMLEV